MSEDNLEISSPDLLVSKNSISFEIKLLYKSFLKSKVIFSPKIL